MKILKFLYKKFKKKEPPYYYDYSLITIIKKPIRKFFTNVIASNCPFNNLRILIYKLCGFKIGKKVFIGMHCYLDDMCFDLITIKDNVIISYGVYFACHGKSQNHYPILIEENVYIGMRASIISKNTKKVDGGVTIGKGSIIGACSLINKDIPPYATAYGIPCKIILKEKIDIKVKKCKI